jgi:hypothetical protein
VTTATLLASLLSAANVMPLADVKPGQEGTCLTVFEGEAIEPFTFVVKGVMENFLGPGRDLVLVRLIGDKPEFTGVVAGMSGSPCSINGKMLGALSYAFAQFAKEPIAGITPIDGMEDVMKLPEERQPWRIDGAEPLARVDDWKALKDGVAVRNEPQGDLRPIATPLTLGGVMPQVQEHFRPWLESLGFMPMGGGTSVKGGGPEKLVPGSAVAAVLVRGDVDIAATGTVTSVEGDQVLAFGHPFLGAGAISVPMATASILNTMASQLRSFKMSATGRTIGEVTQDRLTAIGGYIGRKPKMIPVQGVMHSKSGDRKFTFEVARDFALSPRFTAVGLANSLYGNVEAGDRGTVRLKGVIKAKGMEPLEINNVWAGQRDGGLLIRSAVEMARNFSTLWDTPFGAPPAMELEVDAKLEPEPIEEWIESVHLDRTVAKPGEPLEVAVRLRRDDGPESIERFQIHVPRAWAGQRLDVIVASSEEADELAEVLAGDARPENIQQIRDWLAERRSNGNLYLMVVRHSPGMRSEVATMAFVPPSIIATMSGDASKQRRNQGLAWEERRARPGVVYGGLSHPLTVRAP